jgi:hypothetical protein
MLSKIVTIFTSKLTTDFPKRVLSWQIKPILIIEIIVQIM